MLFDVAEDDLTHTRVNSLRVSLRGKDADFRVCPCPIPHAGEEVIVLAVLLHPYKSHGLIRKAPCRQHFECFTEARERDPEEQSAVLGGKLTDRKCLDVLNAHCRVVAFCRPSLPLLGISPIRPRGIGVDDAVLLHAADLLSVHGKWILLGFRS